MNSALSQALAEGHASDPDTRASRGVALVPSIRHAVGSMGGVLVIIVLLELVTRLELIASRYFPPPTEIARELVKVLGTSGLWTAVGETMQGWFWGLLLAAVIAVPLGMLLGSSQLLFRALRPVVEFLRPVPSVALVPLAILQFGTGMESKVFLATFASIWPLLIQTIYGVRDVKPMQLDTARSYQIRRWDVLTHVVVPSIVPYVATGVRIASSVALILVVTAELVIGSPGLGQDINVARASGAVGAMYALIAVTGLLGWLLNSVFARLERSLLRWHPSHREVAR